MSLDTDQYLTARNALPELAYLQEAESRTVFWDNEKAGAEMLIDKHLAIAKWRRAYGAACYELRERMTG